MRSINTCQSMLFILTFFITGAITFYSCRKETPCNNCANNNKPPIAVAGEDQDVTLPTNSPVFINGNGSSDPDNNIISYRWSRISGPSSLSFANANWVRTEIANLVEGIYLLELKVTDEGGLFSKDTMQVKVVNSDVDIYVAGKNHGVALYWKNGKAMLLENSPSDFTPVSIAVAGNNIGVAASRYWDEYVGKYWKNGQEVILGNYSGAHSIAIDGSDVYVAGWEWEGNAASREIAKYWKNGQAVSLTNGTKNAYANAIAIAGNDVYVAGEEGDVAKYWKNGQAVSLTNGLNQAYATSIAVVGSDVYVAGWEWEGTIGIAKYWKNGVAVTLSEGRATSIAVAGNNVYVAGYSGNYSSCKAAYWKNGQKVLLTNGQYGSVANSIAVYKNDVYIAGSEYSPITGNYVATYWKNGKAVVLSDNGSANSIVVIPH